MKKTMETIRQVHKKSENRGQKNENKKISTRSDRKKEPKNATKKRQKPRIQDYSQLQKVTQKTAKKFDYKKGK